MTYEEALEYAAVRVRQGDEVIKALLLHIGNNHALMREAAMRIHCVADDLNQAEDTIAELEAKVSLMQSQRDEAERRYVSAIGGN
jgi:chromosome segregation ATPase